MHDRSQRTSKNALGTMLERASKQGLEPVSGLAARIQATEVEMQSKVQAHLASPVV